MNNLKKYNYIFIFLIPALIVIYRSYITKLLYFSDPDYAYIFNGLNINILKLPYYSDHPGVPFTIFIAIGLRFIYWFSGHNLDIQTDVLTNPEYYEWRLHWMLFSTIILSTIILGIFVYKKTKNISLTVVLQSIPFLFDTSLEILSTRLMPDVMLIIILQIVIALIVSFFYKANNNQSTRKEELLFPIVLGLGLAIKIIILPVLFLPVLIQKLQIKKLIKYFSLVLVSFIFFTLPVYKQYPNMFGWFFSLFAHSGIYGQGAKTIIDFSAYFNSLSYILTYNIFFSIIFTFSFIGFTFFSIIKNKVITVVGKPLFLINIALFITTVLSFLIVAKTFNGKNYYLIVTYTLMAFSFICNLIIFFQIFLLKYRKLYFYFVLLFLIINIALNFRFYKGPIIGWEMSKNEIEELNQFLKKQNDYVLVTYNAFSINKPQALLFGQVFSIVHLEKLKQIYPNTYYFNLLPNQFSNWLTPIDIHKISEKIFMGDGVVSDNHFKVLKENDLGVTQVFKNRSKILYELIKYKTGFKNTELYNRIISKEMNRIKDNTQWYQLVKDKAVKNKMSIDSMLYLDAKWMIDEYFNKDTVLAP